MGSQPSERADPGPVRRRRPTRSNHLRGAWPAVTRRAADGTAAARGRVRSPLHHEWVASFLGVALGVSFAICFATGIVDHLAQSTHGWFHLPARPINLYRVNEGVHVVTGIATIPLLLAKLWAVWPELLSWPLVRSVAHGLERLSLVFLVGGSLFELTTGVLNIDYWYSPMPFFFPTAHYWVAWMVVGALVIHVGAKWATAVEALSNGPGADREPHAPAGATAPSTVAQPAPVVSGPVVGAGGLSRRGFVAAAVATAGTLAVVVVGETVGPLRRLAVLAPRNPVVGPQRLPVNQTALQAGVRHLAIDPTWRLQVVGDCASPRSFSLDELRGLPLRSAGLPITCVEGWSASAMWRGVPLATLLREVGARPGAAVTVESLESSHRLYSSSEVDAEHAADPDTLLALDLDGEVLDLDHGYPVRLIAPDRPGVLQTKWLSRVVVH